MKPVSILFLELSVVYAEEVEDCNGCTVGNAAGAVGARGWGVVGVHPRNTSSSTHTRDRDPMMLERAWSMSSPIFMSFTVLTVS